jgi:hypothetical protein
MKDRIIFFLLCRLLIGFFEPHDGGKLGKAKIGGWARERMVMRCVS